MYALGHLGIGLLAFAPVALYLRRTNRTPLAAVGTVQVVALSTIPDVDLLLAGVSHRGITHTIWFALAVGSVLATFAILRTHHRPTALGPARSTGAIASGLTGSYAVATHLVGDVVTPMGVAPLAPVVDAHYSLAIVNAADPTANLALFALGCLATTTGWLAGTGSPPRRTPTARGVPGWLIDVDRRPWRRPSTQSPSGPRREPRPARSTTTPPADRVDHPRARQYAAGHRERTDRRTRRPSTARTVRRHRVSDGDDARNRKAVLARARRPRRRGKQRDDLTEGDPRPTSAQMFNPESERPY
ncbi:metal-dependent hydrolase [Halorubellus sp. JP-L1]|uniref:metal-dependent hydrolase n=1 Tax=Halorubellus sp. JP-L1 TaxID=2715753 RepID=UPI001408DE44|nr:metal-dependent hydrolase [Halorubellus sp. JP-L1]